MLRRHPEYFKLNKNILIAFAASLTISAIFAQLISEQADYMNTTYTLMVDYLVYLSTFGGLYYLSNKQRYLLETGKVNKAKLRRDILKIITSLGISEIAYAITRWLFQYYLLTADYDPYTASMASQTIAMAVYMIVINISVKMTRMYKDGN